MSLQMITEVKEAGGEIVDSEFLECTCDCEISQKQLTEDQKIPNDKHEHTYGTRAAIYGCQKCLSYILSLGHDVDKYRDKYGRTMLQCTSRNGHIKCVKLLCAAKADVNHSCPLKRTPLHEASKHGHTAVVSTLCEYGANFHRRNKNGRSPLDVATVRRYDEVVSVLVNYLRQEVVRILEQYLHPSLSSLFPLIAQYVSSPTHMECVCSQELEDNDVMFDHILIHNKHGHTCGTKAAIHGCVKCIKWLLEKNIDPNNSKDSRQSSMLHCAAYRGRLQCCKILCEYNADINIRDKSLKTPLHRAVAKGHFEVVKLLCQFKGKLNLRDQKSLTCIDIARGKQPQIYHYFQERREFRRLLLLLHRHSTNFVEDDISRGHFTALLHNFVSDFIFTSDIFEGTFQFQEELDDKIGDLVIQFEAIRRSRNENNNSGDSNITSDTASNTTTNISPLPDVEFLEPELLGIEF